jgi:hypothetical protein
MDNASVARRRRPPKRISLLDTDEWAAVARTVNLLSLALDGLEERSRSSILEATRDVVPIVWTMFDLRAALEKLEIRAGRATLPLPRPAPTPPAELADPDRQPT